VQKFLQYFLKIKTLVMKKVKRSSNSLKKLERCLEIQATNHSYIVCFKLMRI